jgi:ribosomal protein S18 acetylase RimI-like enzyme
MSSIRIRQATLLDSATVADFNSRMALETENRRLDPDRVHKGVTALLKDSSKGTYFVAEWDGKIVGQLLITFEWSDWRNGTFWWIQSVYVAGESRGSGVFRALFQHVEALAKEAEDVCGLRLYVEAENKGAQDTYVRLGMKRTNYEMFESDYVMQ